MYVSLHCKVYVSNSTFDRQCNPFDLRTLTLKNTLKLTRAQECFKSKIINKAMLTCCTYFVLLSGVDRPFLICSPNEIFLPSVQLHNSLKAEWRLQNENYNID